MSYALFFYSYALTLLTAAVFVGFGALYIRRKKRLHLLVALLFGLYLIDIMFLWMVEFIPEFAGLFQDMQTGHPFVYTLFNTLIILTYRAILGDLLDHPISNVEAAFWLLCFVGIIAEWSIKNDLYRVAADLIFPYTLQIWTIVSAFWIYARQRDVVERSRGRAAIFFAIVYSTCEILEIISTSNTLRSIFFEALGLIYTVSGSYIPFRASSTCGNACGKIVSRSSTCSHSPLRRNTTSRVARVRFSNYCSNIRQIAKLARSFAFQLEQSKPTYAASTRKLASPHAKNSTMPQRAPQSRPFYRRKHAFAGISVQK